MDFFDNAAIKAKEVFDVACKKTNEVVNTGKYKFDIASLENKLSKDYERLGKIYYNMIKDTEVEDKRVIELKAAIAQKQDEIKRLQEEINNIKSKRFCPECGVAVDKSSVFCSNCGVKLEFDSEKDF
ncbi:MAG: zinc-ribbon domain-containing protein [Acutalibacteraceae bacterium]|jgi:hypothetical protein